MPENRFVMPGHEDVSPPRTPTNDVHHKVDQDDLKRTGTLHEMRKSLQRRVTNIRKPKPQSARSGGNKLVPVSEERPTNGTKTRPPPPDVSLSKVFFSVRIAS